MLVSLIDDIRQLRAADSNDARLGAARVAQRRAQFFLDFIEAENSMGFHAGGEAARILAKSIDYLRQGQIVIRDQAPK